MAPGRGSGSAALSRLRVPTLENSGQVTAFRVPIAVSASEQLSFPSAALGLIDTPSGKIVVEDLISEGDGVVALSSCGTRRSTSTPLGASDCVVVGFAVRLGLKVSCSQPVVSGHAASA